MTIPAGTARAAPASLSVAFSDGIPRRLTITVPPGPSGLLGFQVAQSGQAIIPRTPGAFVIADDRVIQWDLDGYPDAGRYSIIGYNTDLYDHTLYVEFEVDELTAPARKPLTILPIG